MKNLLFVFLTVLIVQSAIADNTAPVGEFSLNRLDGWEPQRFTGETDYQLLIEDSIMILKANSQHSASGLVKEKRIDLHQTPYLNWSWRIANRLTGLNEQTKTGDDFAARTYVIIKTGLAFWQTRALNYVWAGSSAKDSVWPNAFAGDHTMMLAVRGSEAPVNVWQTEKHNVHADLKKIFGEDFRYIDAIAIMTDTDNSNTQATAFYGDIWFSKD